MDLQLVKIVQEIRTGLGERKEVMQASQGKKSNYVRYIKGGAKYDL